MNILLSFDTEDYVTPEADDAVKYYAETLSDMGIRGTFFVVAEKLRALKRRKRYDVIDAMRQHDIGYHSNTHSVHPTINEYQEKLSWQASVERLVRIEKEGLREVAETFEHDIIAVCPPGANWSAQMLAGFGKLGLSVCAGAMIDGGEDRPACYSGLLNLRYDLEDMGDPFMSLANANQAWPRFKQLYDRRKTADGFITIFTHPTMLVSKDFWDVVNIAGGLKSTENLIPSPLKPACQISSIKSKYEEFLNNARKLNDIEFITYTDLHERYKADNKQNIDPETIQCLASKMCTEFSWHKIGGQFFSPAEAFALLGMHTLSLLKRQAVSKQTIPEIIGPTEKSGESIHISEVKVSEIRKGLSSLFNRELSEVPSKIKVRGRHVGPHWIIAASSVVIQEFKTWSGQKEQDAVQVPEFKPLPVAAYTEQFQNIRYKGSWAIFPEGFSGKNLIHYNMLQSWSYKPWLVSFHPSSIYKTEMHRPTSGINNPKVGLNL